MLTRAERTGYAETTGYDEVVEFIERAAGLSDGIHVTSFGATVEGRALPLVVVGDVADARPASVTAAEGIRVWLQGNIHGGEVCGKEALLMLLRDLAAGQHAAWRSSLVLLIAPIYNADGNERMALDNRPYQLGPVGGMGTRRNAQDLDLNRDHMKLGSPEARALVRAYRDYDPHVVIDLHTTNGTQHAYHLTYAPPLHPNTHPAIDALLRDELEMASRKGLPTIFASAYSRRRDGDRGGREVTGWRMDAAVAVDAKTRPPRLGHAADDLPTAPTSRLVIGPAKAWGMVDRERVSRVHAVTFPARCGSKQVPSRSMAQATLSRRSATERSERACPWPRLRSA